MAHGSTPYFFRQLFSHLAVSSAYKYPDPQIGSLAAADMALDGVEDDYDDGAQLATSTHQEDDELLSTTENFEPLSTTDTFQPDTTAGHFEPGTNSDDFTPYNIHQNIDPDLRDFAVEGPQDPTQTSAATLDAGDAPMLTASEATDSSARDEVTSSSASASLETTEPLQPAAESQVANMMTSFSNEEVVANPLAKTSRKRKATESPGVNGSGSKKARVLSATASSPPTQSNGDRADPPDWGIQYPPGWPYGIIMTDSEQSSGSASNPSTFAQSTESLPSMKTQTSESSPAAPSDVEEPKQITNKVKRTRKAPASSTSIAACSRKARTGNPANKRSGVPDWDPPFFTSAINHAPQAPLSAVNLDRSKPIPPPPAAGRWEPPTTASTNDCIPPEIQMPLGKDISLAELNTFHGNATLIPEVAVRIQRNNMSQKTCATQQLNAQNANNKAELKKCVDRLKKRFGLAGRFLYPEHVAVAKNNSWSKNIAQDESGPQYDLTANEWRLECEYGPEDDAKPGQFVHAKLSDIHTLIPRENWPQGNDRLFFTQCLEFAADHPEIDLDTSHWDWLEYHVQPVVPQLPNFYQDNGLTRDHEADNRYNGRLAQL